MTITKKLMLIAALLASGLAYAQGVRYDIPPILGPTGQPLPNIAVSLCSGTGAISGPTCSPQTQSFTDITLGIPCAPGNPVTLTASSACQNTSDSFGNAGFWLSPGAYIFCLTGRGIAGSCYNLTVPAGSTPSGTLRSGTIQLGDGTAAAPSHSFTNQTGTGFFHPGGGSTGVSVAGTQRFNFGSNLQQDGTAGSYCFTNGNPFSVTCDVGFSRDSAGVIDIGNGTVGDASGAAQGSYFRSINSFGGFYRFTDTSGAANTKNWDIFGQKTKLEIRALDDAFNTPTSVIQLIRGSGTAVSAAQVGNSIPLVFSTGVNLGDTGLSRSAAGTVAIGNGTAGDSSGTLLATTVTLPATGLIKLGSNLGISSFGAPTIAFGNGTQGSATAILESAGAQFSFASTSGADLGVGTLGVYTLGSNGVWAWTSAAANASPDTGLSRASAGVVSVGNGTQGNTSGTLKATTVNAVSGFQVNGTALAAANLSNGTTGSGAVVLATSPTLTNPTLNSPTFITPNIGSASANTLTFTNQAAPANPAAGSITIYGDSGTGNLTCRNSSGGSCLSATAAAPFISSSANPATTGVLRVATGDIAVAFRNNANSGDIAALTKDTSDVVQVGGTAGMKTASLGVNASPNGTAGDATFARTTTAGAVFLGSDGNFALFRPSGAFNTTMFSLFGGQGITFNSAADTGISRTAAGAVAIGNGSAGNTSGTLTLADVSTNAGNPAQSGVFRCSGNQGCAVARTPDNTTDVQLGYALNGPLAVFGSVGGSTSSVTAEVGKLQVDVGVKNNGSGVMHFRSSGTSCTTPAAAGATCTTTISLPGTFPDTNYTAVCVVGPGANVNTPIIQGIGTKTTTSITLTVTGFGAASSYASVDCIAIHD